MARFFKRRFRGRRGRRSRGPMYKVTKNQFLQDFTQTTGGTEQASVFATGVDDATNRSTHIPAGATLTSIRVIGQAETVNAGTYMFGILRSPGGTSHTTPLANYFATTDPMTEETIKARRNMLKGPFRFVQPSAAVSPVRVKFNWRGRMLIQDGDDIALLHLMPATNQVLDTRIFITYVC